MAVESNLRYIQEEEVWEMGREEIGEVGGGGGQEPQPPPPSGTLVSEKVWSSLQG